MKDGHKWYLCPKQSPEKNTIEMAESARAAAAKRLTQEYFRLKQEPLPYIEAEPDSADILKW